MADIGTEYDEVEDEETPTGFDRQFTTTTRFSAVNETLFEQAVPLQQNFFKIILN